MKSYTRWLAIGLLATSIIALPGAHTATAAWQSIIGIPQPPFGANETAPAVPNPWSSGVAGFYYVCPTCSGATDSGNTYGYPAKPRATVPSPVPAGAVVEVHGTIGSSGGERLITVNGTASSPAFVRGASYEARPKIVEYWGIQGAYGIFENLGFGPASASASSPGVGMVEGTHDIAVRTSEFSGNATRSGGIGLGTWSYNGSGRLYNVVLDGNYIHDIGDVNSSVDQDAHGITVNGSVDNLWVVNNEIARTSGDAMQLEAQQGRRDKIHHVYFGRNHTYGNKQSGGWIKHATDVIFSQNTIHDHRAGNSSFGQCTGWQYGPEYVWIIFNELYNCDVGVGAGSGDPPGDGANQFIIGNIVHDIHSSRPTDTSNAGAFMIRGGGTVRIIGNTVYSNDAGLNAPVDGITYNIENNIFANRTQSTQYDIYMEGSSSSANSTVKNNLFYHASSVRINWNSSSYTSLSAFQSATGKGQSSISADPKFVSPSSGNFALQSTSPAIDKGSLHAAYATFRSRYGFDILQDVAGATRPQGAAWDIGAYEYAGTGSGETVPTAPTGLVAR